MMATIELSGMEFHAFHGCLPEERRDGNLFVVDFECEYDISKAASSDSLEDALNYAEVYDLIKAQMQIPSNLLEHLAVRIADAVSASFPQIQHLSLRVAKAHPPVSGPVKWSSVKIER